MRYKSLTTNDLHDRFIYYVMVYIAGEQILCGCAGWCCRCYGLYRWLADTVWCGVGAIFVDVTVRLWCYVLYSLWLLRGFWCVFRTFEDFLCDLSRVIWGNCKYYVGQCIIASPVFVKLQRTTFVSMICEPARDILRSVSVCSVCFLTICT